MHVAINGRSVGIADTRQQGARYCIRELGPNLDKAVIDLRSPPLARYFAAKPAPTTVAILVSRSNVSLNITPTVGSRRTSPTRQLKIVEGPARQAQKEATRGLKR